jgi:hypothetical protein
VLLSGIACPYHVWGPEFDLQHKTKQKTKKPQRFQFRYLNTALSCFNQGDIETVDLSSLLPGIWDWLVEKNINILSLTLSFHHQISTWMRFPRKWSSVIPWWHRRQRNPVPVLKKKLHTLPIKYMWAYIYIIIIIYNHYTHTDAYAKQD